MMATQTPPVEQRVRAQAAFIASAAFNVLLPLVLVTLAVASAWTGWVNVMAMRTYLDSPEALPGVTWAVPVAVQTFIIAGEATMVLNSVLCRRWIVISGAAAAVAGYGAETGAHVYYGATPDTTVTMIVSAVACGGGWALVAALMHRGVEIANGDAATADTRVVGSDPADTTDRHPTKERTYRQATALPDRPRPDKDEIGLSNEGGPVASSLAKPTAPVEAAASARGAESAPTTNAHSADVAVPGTGATEHRRRRRTRAELLDEVLHLAPDRATLSPNYVAERVGISWANAKSLLKEVDRLAFVDSHPGPRQSDINIR